MLPYTSFDDAWGAPIAPQITNPYKDVNQEQQHRPHRSDVDVCREVMAKTMATQGCLGVRRLMGPSICAAMDQHRHKHAPRHTRFASVSHDDLILLLLLGILLLLFLRD